MKVRDFLNEAWLRGRFDDPKSEHTLKLLQEFFDNGEADVYAFAGGLLVLDIGGPELVKGTNAIRIKGGKLYLIDNYHPRQVKLTDDEERRELLAYSSIFMSDPDYYQTENGPERFYEDYKQGLLGSKNNDQPGEN